MSVHVARYSLALPMIEVGIELGAVNISIITSGSYLSSLVQIMIMWLLLTVLLLVS